MTKMTVKEKLISLLFVAMPEARQNGIETYLTKKGISWASPLDAREKYYALPCDERCNAQGDKSFRTSKEALTNSQQEYSDLPYIEKVLMNKLFDLSYDGPPLSDGSDVDESYVHYTAAQRHAQLNKLVTVWTGVPLIAEYDV